MSGEWIKLAVQDAFRVRKSLKAPSSVIGADSRSPHPAERQEGITHLNEGIIDTTVAVGDTYQLSFFPLFCWW